MQHLPQQEDMGYGAVLATSPASWGPPGGRRLAPPGPIVTLLTLAYVTHPTRHLYLFLFKRLSFKEFLKTRMKRLSSLPPQSLLTLRMPLSGRALPFDVTRLPPEGRTLSVLRHAAGHESWGSVFVSGSSYLPSFFKRHFH